MTLAEKNQIIGIKTGTDGCVNFCVHCGLMAKGKGQYCLQCSRAEGRKEQCEENNKHFEEVLGKPYICKLNCLNNKAS